MFSNNTSLPMITWGSRRRQATERVRREALKNMAKRDLHGRTVLVIVVLLALVATSCSSGGDVSQPDGPTTTPAPGGTNPGGQTTSNGQQASGPLKVRLSAGQGASVETEPVQVVAGDPLSDSETAAIIDRLPEWLPDTDDQEDFNRPPESLPPPLVGETIESSFPASVDLDVPEVSTDPLEVLRVQPEGEVDIAPVISITFNQPMVPITTLAQLDTLDVPATISPAVPGRWQWIGTRTLRFEYQADDDGLAIDRLPMATDYVVEVPAGTTSQDGKELAETVRFEFSTPPVRVERFQPQNDGKKLDPIFVVVFDQLIDPAAVLDTIEVKAGRDNVEIVLATDAEIAADPVAAERVAQAEQSPGRWMAFRARELFERDTDIVVTIGPDTPSAEGPRTAGTVETFTARTFAPLRIDSQSCRRAEECPPRSDLWISFNNELNLDTFDPAQFVISPELPGATISADPHSIVVRGATEGRTDYEVTVPAGLTDVWDQTLGEDVTVRFEIGEAPPSLVPFPQPVITVDPYVDTPTTSIVSVNHDKLRVDLYPVDPEDWALYVSAYRDSNGDDEPLIPPVWERAATFEIEPDGGPDEISETPIDLSAAIDGDHGHVVVVVSSVREFDRDDRFYWINRPAVAWVQATDIGLDAFTDSDQLVVWTTDLATGRPLADVEVTLEGATGATTTTDTDGLGRLELRDSPHNVIIARSGSDSVLLGSPWDEFRGFRTSDVARWHIFDDRSLYRPGETVSVKGWVRRLTLDSDAQLRAFESGATVSYTVTGPQGNEIAADTVPLSALGGFDLEVELPANVNLGFAQINFALDGVQGAGGGLSGYHSFQIEEFRRPEFEVTVSNQTPGPYLRTEPATVGVDATYFAGGPLPNAPVEWTVTTRDATYRPPNWDDFSFGIWVPWWIFHGGIDDFGDRGFAEPAFEGDFFPGPPFDEGTVEQFSGITDGAGQHFLRMDFEGDETDQPVTVTAQAGVTDVNRQAWADATDLLVHPADLYVGLLGERTFVREGEPLDISTIVTDIDGSAEAGVTVDITADRIEWQYKDGTWQEVPVDTQSCQVTSEAEPVSCSFETDQGGEYTITAIVADSSGRKNRSELTRWVSGGQQRPDRRLTQEVVTLIPDQVDYQPGDTAEILVEAPFANGEGLLTIARNGIVSTSTFSFDGTSTVLEIPIEDEHIPTLHLQVDVVGSSQRVADDGTPLEGAPDRPAYAVGGLQLDVPPTSRTLDVTATPANAQLEPGGDTSVEVTVLDASGSPVAGAELAVVVVDEAVLALTNHQTPDPLSAFYGSLGADIRSTYGRAAVVLENPLLLGDDFDKVSDSLDDGAAAPTAEGGELSAAEAPAEESADFAGDEASNARLSVTGSQPDAPAIDVRTNFDALAVFAPEVTTGADGRATIDVPLPDNLTRYRIMVLAANGADEFGSTESNITARLPLMVRPSAPRFLNFGDRFELPVVLQNQTDQEMDVEVVVETSNLELTDRSGARVTVPANDRIEVRFPATADEAGTARFRVSAVSADASDAATVSLPVYTPATAEAFATYGVLDGSVAVAQPVLAPTDVWPQFGGLEVNTSSTALQALTDAILYISDYRYESADALASRILAITALRDVLQAFDAEGLPAPAVLLATVQADLDGLAGLQNGDGGFPIWSRNSESWPYHSVHVTHALVEAQNNGYDVPQQTLNRALDHIRSIEEFYPPEYGPQVRATISAYALHVRHLAGDTDTAKAEALYRNSGDDLTLEATAWLWPVITDPAIDDEIERLFVNRATETAGAATFATDYGEDSYLVLHSSRRTDGIILDALVALRPASDLIPKVVTGLLGNQTRGRWQNMQENTFILLALNNYFDAFEADDPDFVARIWLGDIYAAEHTYQGRSTDRNETVVPMAELLDQGDSDLVVSKDGDPGRLYYRLGLRYAPTDLDLDPLDRGFVVQRTYEGIDNPDDAVLDGDGNWHIRAGAEIRVRLTMVADSRRTHVALIDPMAAGMEALNPALAATPDVPADNDPAESSYYYWRWFRHQNLRDDRAEAFTPLLRAGTYDYTYVARATTPGTFVTPPARAEEMYAPETFGRSGTDIVIVE